MATANWAARTATPVYRPTTYVSQQQTLQRAGPNVRDDYERWYTEGVPNNRMLLSLRSGIHTEITWALDRLCRLCDNEQFLLRAIPGLTDALFEWPEWYAKEGYTELIPLEALFVPNRDQERKRRHALESLFVLRNACLIESNAVELGNHPRTQPLVLAALKNLQPEFDSNIEFLLYTIEILCSISTKIVLSRLPSIDVNPVPYLEKYLEQSSNRSLIVVSLSTLTSILSANSNISHLSQNSPAFEASLRYLPLFVDKSLVDACLNFIYVYLSHQALAKAFLHHKKLSGTLKILVSLLLSEQVEETVTENVTGPVESVPSLTVHTRPHDLSKEELDSILEKPEPQRCYDWMQLMFVAKADGELTQVDFWNLYKDVFVPYADRFPLLVASDVIKNVNVVFPQAQAMVLPGPPQRFVVRGVDRRRETTSGERFKCRWDRDNCPQPPFDLPGTLYEHILEHINANPVDHPCAWSSCPWPMSSKPALRKHVLTHLSSSQPPVKHPSQSDTITLVPGVHTYPTPDPTTRLPPPPPLTNVTYRRPIVDPPSNALTALLCIRLLFRTSFASADAAPRADADHFGFPGLVEDTEEQDVVDTAVGTLDEQAGESRGRQAFLGVRRLLEEVRIRDEVLMGWILDMADAGLSGTT